jgi:trimethylamine---corrinoid protein Co-methyltransferase
MKVNAHEQKTLGLNLISRDQIENIHSATMEVLEKVGVEVKDTEALELLRHGGAKINGSSACIPSWMVERALSTAPSRVAISDRNGNTSMVLEKNRIYYGSGSDTPYILDLDGQRRAAVLVDIENSTRLADALPNIDFVMSLGVPSDVPKEASDIYQVKAIVTNTTKPLLYTSFNRENLAKIIAIAEAIADGEEELRARPFLCLYNEPSSPLTHSGVALQKLLYCAEKRLPMNYTPAVMMGGTGPVTLAGSLVIANSELLSGLVIHQLKSEGAPIIFGGGTPPMDLKTTVSSYGAPEVQLGCSILAAISRYYGLPVFVAAGCSDAHLFDQQAGMEAGYSILMAGLAGANLIHDCGYLSAGMMSSMEMLVLCDETIGLVKHILKGIEINTNTLALEVITAVGPGGNFFGEEHTFNNFRSSMHLPDLLNRQVFQNWEQDGCKTYGQKANEKIRYILKEHDVPDLSAEVKVKIDAILT